MENADGFEGLEAGLEGTPCPPASLAGWRPCPTTVGLLQTIAEAGEGAWLVGDVRDAWLGEAAPDIDVCTTHARTHDGTLR